MIRDTIIRNSITLTVYFVTDNVVVNGVTKRQYDEMEIRGCFQPKGQYDHMGKMYNEVSGKWRLYTLTKHKLRKEYLLKIRDEFYKVVEVKDWSAFGNKKGYFEYELELASPTDREDITKFWERSVDEDIC